MSGNKMISLKQFMLLVILFTMGSSILLIPTSLASEARQDAWITAILGIGVGMLLALLYSTIGRRSQNMTIVQYSEKVLGKWIGKLVSIWFCIYTFILSGLILRNIGEFVVIFLLPDTPIEIIFIIFLFIVIVGTRLGVETMARSGEILFIFVIFLYLIVVFGLLPEVKLERLQPVFEGGVKPILRSLIPYIGSPYLELVVLLMIFHMINVKKKAKKTFLIGTLFGGIPIMISVFYCLVVLGPDITAAHIFSGFTVIKKINIGNFLQRLESLIAIIAIICVFFKVTICFYASALGFAQILNVKDFKFLTFPMGLILVVFSIIAYPNIIYANTFFNLIWTPYSLTTGLLLPLTLLIVGDLRKKKKS